MPVITEGMLRKLDKEGQLEKIHITEKDILTPSAREFLNVKKIDFRIKKSQEKFVNNEKTAENKVKDSPANASEEKVIKKRQYRDYITGAVYDKKPEFMTQLFGDNLVVKNHKRIVLRGKFDILQAEIIRYWKKYEKNKKLEGDFAQVYRFVRDLFISEMTDMEFQEKDVLGYDIDTLKDITHNTVKYFKTGHLFEINIDFDESVIDINYLRALSRECEVAAVDAFYKEGKVERVDMLKALNRLSSILYLMMLKANNGDYK
ncbi:cobalamin adenosyltransferase [Leptotrichia trevisanii]|uniref:cobalamin adenosyltransferase n=1 Tax=Leptotrichia trevisanii TaxID=109328 RepID=UPI0004208D02|nr:cobalamin adenosyltransferase [Leptotrichia trevisanii]